MRVTPTFDDFREEYDELVKYYDAIANGYDELHYIEQKEKFDKIINNMIISVGSRVLDVGCGTFFSFDFFRKYGWDIYGIEPSPRMVELFKVMHKNEEYRIRVGFAQELLNFYGNDSFDHIICVSVAHHFKDPNLAFEQMKKVCKPYGYIVITVLKGVREYRGLVSAIKQSFSEIKIVESSKDEIYICKNDELEHSKPDSDFLSNF